jgi:putative hemolysin
LGDLRAGALMTPRTDIHGLDLQDPLDENLRRVIESLHTHLPVYDGSLDNVTGILRTKDLLARTGPQDTVEFLAKIDLPSLTMPAQYVPESMPAFQVLEVLRSASGNLAMVIDEFGGTVGMVTLFDVMEAMVGGISEQGEPVVPDAVQREDGSWLVEGMMRIDAFKDLLEIDYLPEEERADYQTVGGFVMTALGSIPGTGQHFSCCGWHYEVVDMDGRRVDKILVTREN